VVIFVRRFRGDRARTTASTRSAWASDSQTGFRWPTVERLSTPAAPPCFHLGPRRSTQRRQRFGRHKSWGSSRRRTAARARPSWIAAEVDRPRGARDGPLEGLGDGAGQWQATSAGGKEPKVDRSRDESFPF